MTRPRLGIGSELLPVCLILATLAGSSFLVVSMHRRAAVAKKNKRVPPLAAAPVTPSPVQLPPAPSPAPKPKPSPAPAPPAPAPPVEDPTQTALVRLGTVEAEQLLEAQAADRKAASLEQAARSARLDSERWKRREQLVRNQIETINNQARSLEQEADSLASDLDVLAHELDAAKAALEKSKNRSSYAVLPNRAPNGTWRRPIVIECRNATATIQPGGPTFNMLDLSALGGARSSPILLAVVRELSRIQGTTGPDGAPTVPYIFFVIRPDGIRPYYDARARLESLGIAFGYELVDQDMEIEFPDFDHPGEWDGSPPLTKFPSLADAGSASRSGNGAGTKPGQGPDAFRWPTGSHGESEGLGVGSERNRTLALGGGPHDDPARSFGRQGIPAARGNGGLPSLADSLPFPGDEGRPPAPGSRAGGGTSTSPGMLPPRGDSRSQPGLLPPSGGSPPRTGLPPGSDSRAGSGRTGIGTGPHSAGGVEPGLPSGRVPTPPPGLPPGLASGRPGAPGAVDPAARPYSAPENVAAADGLTLPGRSPGEISRFGARGLLPGEPGAPPEDGPGVPSAGGSGTGARPGGQPGGSASGQPNGTSSAGSPATGGSGGQPGGRGRSGGGEAESGPLRIEVPMEIVVACRPTGVVIHPGGYTLSRKVLQGKDPVFVNSLKTIVRLRQQVDPMIRPLPEIKFLIEPGGGETYRDVRRQTVLSGLDWPTALQVADTQILDFLPRERF